MLASGTLVSYVSVWRAAARALGELGCGAFFVGGVAWAAIGSAAPWYVLAAVLIGAAVRAVDVEARALFVPGGLYGSVRDALGRSPAKIAASALLVERLMLGPLAAVVAGHYVAALVPMPAGPLPGGRQLTGNDGPVALAVALLAIVWWLQRQGRRCPSAPCRAPSAHRSRSSSSSPGGARQPPGSTALRCRRFASRRSRCFR